MYAQMIMQMIQAVVQRAIMIGNLTPGPIEKKYRKEIKADRQRLSGGRGGLATGTRQGLEAEGTGAIHAQMQNALAALARGSADDSGGSGLQAAQQNDLYKQGLAATNAMTSNVRAQDLMYAESQRADLHRRMETAIAMSNTRKSMASNTKTASNDTSGGGGGGMDMSAFSSGQSSRTTQGGAVSGAAGAAGG